jgi:TolA-binding protein
MRSKVKITKQQIKQDKFTTAMLQAKEWLMTNWQITSIIAAIAVLVIVGVIYIVGSRSGKQMEAASRLASAYAELKRDNSQVAILELGSIADDYSGYIAGRAQFYLANAHYDNRNYDEAINDYQKYIDKFHENKLTTASAIAGIAYCMENKQEFIPAGEKFLEAIKYYPGTPLAPDYYVGAVRCFTAADDFSRADEVLTDMKEKFPNTDYTRQAIMLVMRENVE